MLKHLLTLVFLLPLSCMAQFTISGRIINQADKEPVQSASVFLSEATNGTASAKDGTFTLSNIKPGRYTLVVSIVGYELFSEPVDVSSNLNLGDIALFGRTETLKEVVVRDDPYRDSKLKLFKQQFLGTSPLTDECKILNPQVLNVDYNDETKVLTAVSTDFLEIENDALGYKLKYLLTDFTSVIVPDSPSFKFKGEVMFEELQGSPSQEKRWEKARFDVYKNSSVHFYRALMDNRLSEEGFKVQQYAHYANPNRPTDSVINAKIELYKKILGETSNARSKYYNMDHQVRDTLAYWKREIKISKYLTTLWPDALGQADILNGTNTPGVFALGCEYDGLFVTYSESHRFDNFKVEHILNAKNTEATLINFNVPFGIIDHNGKVLNPYGISYAGVWFNSREAEHLPVDYAPVQQQAIPVDSTVSKNVLAKLQDYSEKHIDEKVYLHFDKPYYTAADTMFFKAYITSGPNHQPSQLSAVLHVDLISDAKIVQSLNLAAGNGVAWGDFILPDSTNSGTYRVRAYTQLMRNTDNPVFFDKIIPISMGRVKNTVAGSKGPIPGAIKPDIQFLPEGGSMIAGVSSKVAFKAIGSNGLGMPVKGEIVDNDNKPVCKFSAAHLGMGYFYINPEPGKTYKANVSYGNGMSDVVSLLAGSASGIVVTIDNDSTEKVSVKIKANAAYLQANKGKDYTLVIYSGGAVISIITKLDSISLALDVLKSDLHTGIAKFTLFSPQGDPLSERLVFIQNNDQLKMTLSTDKTVYAPRGKVTLKANAANGDGSPIAGQFSISVTDETKEPVDQPNETTIFNKLLLTSDLKGYVEQPNYYFMSSSAEARNNLDLLLLTQGYSGFEWKNVLNDKAAAGTYKAENSLSLSGNVKTLTDKPLPDSKVTLLSTHPYIVRDTTTDANGNFTFTNLNFLDTARLTITAVKKNNSSYDRIAINKPDYPAIIKISSPDSTANMVTPDMLIATQNQIKQRGGNIKTGIVLNEVKIKNKSLNPYGPHLTHSANLNGAGMADQVIMGDKLLGCTSLALCLESLLHGVRFSGSPSDPTIYSLRTPIALVGNTKPMVVIVDGVISQQKVLDVLSSTDVYSVEVLLNASFLVVYGEAASGGAIVITMKRGGEAYSAASNTGSVNYTFNGYYRARTFYSPKYEAEAPVTRPDARTTIFWEPQLITDKDGNASFEFYNADAPGTYRVVIEGIDGDGELGRQVYHYTVKQQ